MKRFQRVFLSLLAVFAVGFSMANAYTFEVKNRSPFGILNLKTLNLKPDTTHTGIILDGANYVIKIDPNHESDGAIRVEAICDEDGNNCKKVSDLGGGGTSSIAIKGDPENFCFKQDEKTLICDNKFLQQLIESRGLGGSINIDGKDGAYCYRRKDDNVLYCDNSGLPSGTANDPKITIYQGGVEKGYFTLNQSANTGIYLDAGGTGTANDSKITIMQGGQKKGEFTLNQVSDKTIALDAGGNYIAGTGITINGNTISAKYNALLQAGIVAAPTEKGKCWKTDSITGQPLRGDCGTSTTSDSLWEETYQTIYIPGNSVRPGQGGGRHESSKVLSPISSATPIYFGNSNFYNAGAFNFYTYNASSNAGPSTRVTFDQKGIRLGEGISMFTGAGLAVGGAIVAGASSTDNYIRIYATGHNDSPDKHYEIMASQELAVGTYSGAYIYFKNYDNEDYSQYRIGVNTDFPTATLDVYGSIRINTTGDPCIQTACTSTNRGTIVFDGSNFYGCTNSGWKKFTTGNGTPSISASCAMQGVAMEEGISIN